MSVREVTCMGGIRCLCDEHTTARLAKSMVVPITDALPPEERVAFLNIAVDAYAVKHAAAVAENTQLRELHVMLAGAQRSMERRVEQVLLHRWRSRIWTAIVTSLAWSIFTGDLARVVATVWGWL